MGCSKCGFDNPANMRFCGNCGSTLELTCTRCGFSNPPAFRFCGGCANDLTKPAEPAAVDYAEPKSYTPKHLTEKILTTRSALKGERKLVTVLFADVANYTALSELLDPEEVHQIMDGCFQVLMDEIHRREGTVNQFTGDGFMALFGAPLAHEDHAQRACHAALAIQREMEKYGEKIRRETGAEFRMRIGLNTGPVIVGAIGDDLRMDYTAVGDTTNLAARVQQAAKAGEVWMSAGTRGLVRDYFSEEAVGEVTLKGKNEPQRLYRLLSERAGVRTRFDAGLIRGITEFVGREREMEALRAAYARAKCGEAELVDIVGEAGVGKSRLVYEFRKTLGEQATVLTGSCLHYGRTTNFHPVIEIVRRAFGIEDGMSETEAGARIQAVASDGLTPFLGFYQNLLSLPVTDPKFNALNPEGRKFGTFEAVKSLLASLSNRKPLVILLEDVHWIDKISEELVTYVSRSVLDRPILLIATCRPEASPTWAQGAHYQRLGLHTLSAEIGAQLVRNLLGGLPIEPALETRVIEHAGGNPFFVEEIMRELLERGDLVIQGDRYACSKPIEQCHIPDTVQGVLAARMDRLSEDLKRTLQVASVIGRDFAFKLLRTILELGDDLRNHLTNLVGLEILYEKALFPELEYIFKHALTQEVAYDSLLKQRRRELHGRIAKTIEELYADKLEPHYEILAHHWELSDKPEKAVEYLVLAGEKSNRSQAANAAMDFFTRALQLGGVSKPIDGKVSLRIRMGRADPLHAMGRIEESIDDYREAIRLARDLGDERTVLACHVRVPQLIYNTTMKEDVPRFCEEGLTLARRLGDKGAEAQIATMYAYWRLLWRHTDEQGAVDEALTLATGAANQQAIFLIQTHLAHLERWRGNPARSLEYTRGPLEMLHAAYNITVASHLAFFHGLDLTDVGRYQEAVAHLSQWVEILERNRVLIALGRFYNALGWAYSETYDLEQAFRFNVRATEHAAGLRKSPANLFSTSELHAMAEVNLMENRAEMGQLDEAWQHIARFQQASADPAYDLVRHRWSARMNHVKASILLARGDLDSVQALARQGLDVAERWAMKKYIGKAERLLGQVMTERRAYDAAQPYLHTALEKLEQVGNPKQLWITHTALAKLFRALGRPDREREHWQAAAAIVGSTAEGLQDEALRKTFLEAAPVWEILEKSGT
ncbi:MAG: AAA family ATPase [Deltaproteobacteria bacterium]|nr:AAA family ATPase [Deltaproteobacteria bacterium]